jgi:EmrB/QacA subfamily drug resistance transporter
MAPVATQPSFLATRLGKLTLTLLCTVAFLDCVDASIVNIALPSMRRDLHMSVQTLQWIPSAYLLTYGGVMLLGGRMADLLGRRRILIFGTVLFGGSSLIAGLAEHSGVLIGARLAQGLGAALMLPAALSILTTTFEEGRERRVALGAWGGVIGLGAAVGVLLGGLLTQGPGWRWVFFVNPPICLLVLGATLWLITDDHRRAELANFDTLGAFLATAGVLLLIYGLVTAPTVGWGAGRTLGGFAGSFALMTGFVANERRHKNPLLPFSIFRIKGLATADITAIICAAGFVAVFFFFTLYMQDVLGYSPVRTGLAYLSVTAGIGIAAGVTSKLLGRIGTRSVIVTGALIASSGIWFLSRVPIRGSYVADLLPGLLIMSIGLGAVFVATTFAGNAGVPSDKAGLAAALLTASQQVGAAIGLAVLSAIATTRTTSALAKHIPLPSALDSGFHGALLAASTLVLAAAFLALRAPNVHR